MTEKPNRRRRTVAVAMAAGGVLAGGLVSPAGAATLPATGGVYQLVVKKSGKCIDVPGASAANGALLQQWGCTEGAAWQQFTLAADGSGRYRLVNKQSGKCVDVPDYSKVSGVQLQQWGCAGQTNQQWTLTPSGTDTYQASRVTITIKPGTYRERVDIPADKPFVTLKGLGDSPDDVVIVNNRNAGDHGHAGSATLVALGRDFSATNLTLSNDFDENSSDTGDQALALYLDADRAVLDDVRLLGDQDTFRVNDKARAYIVDSYIEGTVDFIYGGGTAVFHASTVHEKRSTGGPITAASTPADKTYGFLFYRSTVTGAASKSTQLGRPWRPDAQVLYRESTLTSALATTQPWTDMSSNSWKNARFSEYRNTGAGATVNGNRPQLTDAQAANYTPQKYLAGTDGWNPVR
ncbi:pectinesterase family protein [Streptomyces atroolivaceus]|uniref:pectinesterase family protein n=1 Tax=Streptomyces atroolivaceus TaxID=66869 RepID=UPI0005266E72|nr:pectinesterase family protein [Streptomyces atroolivaceus]